MINESFVQTYRPHVDDKNGTIYKIEGTTLKLYLEDTGALSGRDMVAEYSADTDRLTWKADGQINGIISKRPVGYKPQARDIQCLFGGTNQR